MIKPNKKFLIKNYKQRINPPKQLARIKNLIFFLEKFLQKKEKAKQAKCLQALR